MFHVCDWFPTLLSIAARGVSASSGAPGPRKDWRSLISTAEPPWQLGDGLDNSLMLTAGQSSARTEMVHEAHPADYQREGHGTALRVGKFKLLLNVGRPVGWISEGLGEPDLRPLYTLKCGANPSPENTPNGSLLLFDISADPCEQVDLSAAMPNVLASLQARLAQYVATAVPASFCTEEGYAQCACTVEKTCKWSSDPAQFNQTWTPWCP